MFFLSSKPLDTEQLKANTENPVCGALVTFEGWVRNHNEGHEVTSLEYEAYERLAESEGQRILDEASTRFGLKQAVCVHRTGHLLIGDIAIWIGVSTPHRDAAFKACRYIIDEIKSRVPIWKKEHYISGDSGWVNCEECAKHAHVPKMDYSRQVVLKEIGPMGQRKLTESRVLVIGAGGLGNPVLAYLAGAGVGHIGIVEFDVLEPSNLHRQTLFTPEHIGESKSNLAADWLRNFNPAISVEQFNLRFQKLDENVLESYDLVLECSDCMQTKLQVNRAVVQAGIPAVFASIYQFEGQVQSVVPDSSCLECLYEGSIPEGVPSCAESGVLGAVPGVLGSIQALEAIKQLLQLEGRLLNELLLVDLVDYSMRRIALPKRENCEAHNPEIPLPIAVDVTIDEIELNDFEVIDIREHHEIADQPLPCMHIHIPMNDLMNNPEYLDPEKTYLLVCAAGVRTQYTANAFRAAGHKKVYSLVGGARALM
ncbi:MAG TPA: ThiF family adenylyltransferase [Pontiella sp.]